MSCKSGRSVVVGKSGRSVGCCIRYPCDLANTGNPIQRGNFGGHKGPYLETRMSNFLQTFHTVVWPGDG